MALTITQQLTDRIREGRHHLVVFRALSQAFRVREKSDAIGSALALVRFLRSQNVLVDVASHDFTVPENLRFLDGIDAILPALPAAQKCVITLNLKEQGLGGVHYDIKDDVLSIFVTPKKGTIEPANITAKTTPYLYDCIWIIDAQEWSALGDLYLQNTDLFHRVPTIVVDHNASNEHFGNINVIDITAASTAEVVYRICESVSEKDIDPVMATHLLTGIIARTKSFKTTNMNPRTLALASTLMQIGGDRDRIVDHLFRQRRLSTLKLWGATLTRMTHDARHNIVSSSVSHDAFVQSGADESELPEIIDEIISNAPEAAIAVLLYESPRTQTIKGILYTEKPIDARELVLAYAPKGNEDFVEITIDAATLMEAQERVLQSIVAYLTR